MSNDSKIAGFTGADIMTQTEILRTAMEMMIFSDDEIAETRLNEIRRGVRFLTPGKTKAKS